MIPEPTVRLRTYLITIVIIWLLSTLLGIGVAYGPIKTNFEKRNTDLEYQIQDLEDTIKRLEER